MKITKKIYYSIPRDNIVFLAKPDNSIKHNPHHTRLGPLDYSIFIYDSKNYIMKPTSNSGSGLIKIQLAIKLQTL